MLLPIGSPVLPLPRFFPLSEIVTAEQITAAAINVARSPLDRSFELWHFRLQRLVE